MKKPSQQFVQKLESNLRMLYRSEHPQKTGFAWKNFLRVFLPITTGAFVITFLLISGIFKNSTTLPAQNTAIITNTQSSQETGTSLAFFDQTTTPEEDILNYFDQLDQIDQGVTLVLANQ